MRMSLMLLDIIFLFKRRAPHKNLLIKERKKIAACAKSSFTFECASSVIICEMENMFDASRI